jgi:hypothetical protein
MGITVGLAPLVLLLFSRSRSSRRSRTRLRSVVSLVVTPLAISAAVTRTLGRGSRHAILAA